MAASTKNIGVPTGPLPTPVVSSFSRTVKDYPVVASFSRSGYKVKCAATVVGASAAAVIGASGSAGLPTEANNEVAVNSVGSVRFAWGGGVPRQAGRHHLDSPRGAGVTC